MNRIYIYSLLALGLTACSSNETSKHVSSPAPKKTHVTQSGWQGQVDELDEEIDRLTNQRNLYLAKATRFQNQGDRLQFDRNNLLDARLAWQQAEINREIAGRIQQEIDILETKRAKILAAHGVKSYPKSNPSTSSK
ncbi:MAG: hypothetical protein P0S94_00795 [Simkaniaceae bacterium]|nr:hypothetical protein [Simkaniaceae bacterium]